MSRVRISGDGATGEPAHCGRGETPGMRRALVYAALALLGVSLAACENGAQNMYDQAKYKPQAASDLWPDGRAARPLQTGTVAFSGGDLADSSSGRVVSARGSRSAAGGGGSVDGARVGMYSPAALARGRQRYDIYCVPCHGMVGDGNGYITQRGFPHPPTFHSEKLRDAADQYLFDVMTRGYGAMYPYADRITPADRWAIVGYVRALQRSQNASLDDLPTSERGPLSLAPGRSIKPGEAPQPERSTQPEQRAPVRQSTGPEPSPVAK